MSAPTTMRVHLFNARTPGRTFDGSRVKIELGLLLVDSMKVAKKWDAEHGPWIAADTGQGFDTIEIEVLDSGVMR